MTKKDVINAWAQGQASKRARSSLSTDGRDLYSYDLKIATRGNDGQLNVYNYTSSGKFISQTTSIHVGMVLRQVGEAQLLEVAT
jgi:hypothetical protein